MRDMNFDACILVCTALKWVCYITNSMPACRDKLRDCQNKLRGKLSKVTVGSIRGNIVFVWQVHMSTSVLVLEMYV